jgi:hypothetical protein
LASFTSLRDACGVERTRRLAEAVRLPSFTSLRDMNCGATPAALNELADWRKR